MNKELEALERIGKLEVNGLRVKPTKAIVSDYNDYFIIETALKYHETLKREYEFLRECFNELLNDYNKEHKALEIIKNKKVQVAYLHSMWDDFETTFNNNDEDVRWLYNEGREADEQLTQEEYDLLKEALL